VYILQFHPSDSGSPLDGAMSRRKQNLLGFRNKNANLPPQIVENSDSHSVTDTLFVGVSNMDVVARMEIVFVHSLANLAIRRPSICSDRKRTNRLGHLGAIVDRLVCPMCVSCKLNFVKCAFSCRKLSRRRATFCRRISKMLDRNRSVGLTE
jgi:hypothetical protein